jgi:TatD DNase family protein
LRFGETGSVNTPYFSAGLHPWYLETNNWDAAEQWVLEMSKNKTTLAIGEAGLDKIVKTPWHLQEKGFECCISISESSSKPLIIHCVRAYSEVLSFKKRLQPEQAWIFHGFNKKPAIAQPLLEAGCYLSCGAALCNTASLPVLDTFRQTPINQLFLETDDAQLIDIEQIYAQAARLKGIPIFDLKAQIEENFGRIFGAI